MLQLGVYAAMQVPTGILVDRFGPRRMLLVATVIMGSAQLMFSQVESYPLALVARGLLGCGDAMTYISVLRLVAGWFPARRYPVMVTLTSVVGMAGNVVATVPLTIMLADPRLGPDLRHRRRAVAGVRAAAAAPGRSRRRTGRPSRSDGPAGRPQGAAGGQARLAVAGRPAGLLDPPVDHGRTHRVRRAVGLPVPDPGPGLPARPRRHRCCCCW